VTDDVTPSALLHSAMLKRDLAVGCVSIRPSVRLSHVSTVLTEN